MTQDRNRMIQQALEGGIDIPPTPSPMAQALHNFDVTGAIDVRAIAVEMVECQATIAQAQTRLFELNKQLLDALLV